MREREGLENEERSMRLITYAKLCTPDLQLVFFLGISVYKYEHVDPSLSHDEQVKVDDSIVSFLPSIGLELHKRISIADSIGQADYIHQSNHPHKKPGPTTGYPKAVNAFHRSLISPK